MPIGLDELFIKENLPLLVKEFLLTVCMKYIARSFLTQMFCQEILKFIQ